MVTVVCMITKDLSWDLHPVAHPWSRFSFTLTSASGRFVVEKICLI